VFEVDHFPKSSEEPPSAKSNLPSSIAGLSKSSSQVYIGLTSIDKESDGDIQYSTTETTQETLSPTQEKSQHSETLLIGGSIEPRSSARFEGNLEPGLVQYSQSFEEKADDNFTSQPEPYQVNDFDDMVHGSKKETPKTSTVAPAQSDPEPITSGRVEVLTRLEQFLKSDEVNSKEADLFKRLEKELQKREAHSGRGPAKLKPMPIKFKDAVGRKFSFPFDLCKTWAVSLAADSIIDLSHARLIRVLCREWKNLSVRPFCMLMSSARMSPKVITILLGQMARSSFPRYGRQ
jgi:hypothetical protein